MPIVKCDYCGKEFKRKNSQMRVKNYCSRDCGFRGKRTYNEIIIHENFAEIIIESEKFGIVKTIIDKEDIDKVKCIKWMAHFDPRLNNFYITCGKTRAHNATSLHRVVMNCPKEFEIDHISRNPLDNRKQNLRICPDKFLNRQNQGMRKDNKTGYKNITWNKINKNYRLIIKREKIKILEKSFKTLEEAVKERDRFIKEVMLTCRVQ